MSEIDVHGAVLSVYTHVHEPRHLSSDSEDHVLVADFSSHRILLLDSQLRLQRVLVDRNSQVALREPTRMCYNERTSQLCVLYSSSNDNNNNNSEWSQFSDVISLFNLR